MATLVLRTQKGSPLTFAEVDANFTELDSEITGLDGQVTGLDGQVAGLSSSKLDVYTITTTATSKTLANRERCSVTAAGQTITLPAAPSAGWEVAVTIAGDFNDTVIARNGSNIMSLASDLTVDVPEITVTLYYVDATRGWRII